MTTPTTLRYLQDLWDDKIASSLDDAELLRYRSNLLGRDLRITNFGGGNTSSKILERDPIDGQEHTTLWVKGSGGDLGSIERRGFARLHLDKLLGLKGHYRGFAHEDEMVDFYPLCVFGTGTVAPSIDTPLHAFLPFRHVDHLHPDWGIALAAAANGGARLEEFNRRFKRYLVWLPWQRPGFELAMMLRRAVEENPGCDGIVLGGHGLFTWGDTERECYLNTLGIIDQLGQFVVEHVERAGPGLFGGPLVETLANHGDFAVDLFPFLRGRVSGARRMIGSFSDAPEVLRFANSHDAEKLAFLGTSCPDHFVRTKIRPLFVAWQAWSGDAERLRKAIDSALDEYRRGYLDYYRTFAQADSPAVRDPNPTVVLIAGVGMFSFGRSKAEARITGEFYTNAIHVMEGATALGDGSVPKMLPQASAQGGSGAETAAFQVHHNYVALPLAEAFKIEYWKLEEAKLRRQPPEKEFSRKVFVIIGGAHGIGRATARIAAERGAHVVVADRDDEALKAAVAEITKAAGADAALAACVDIRDRESIRAAFRSAVKHFGGADVLINTAAVFSSSPDGHISDEQWRLTLDVNVTGNHILVDEVRGILLEQALPAAIVLTSSANAVVAKAGSEAYDVSKAAVSHLVRELAISLAPHVRVNGVSPATVVKGSTMFPRDRVLASLAKYGIPHNAEDSTEELRDKLARFYARRTLTHAPIEPVHCAEAILFLVSDRAERTTGHLFPVDGGLAEAFLR